MYHICVLLHRYRAKRYSSSRERSLQRYLQFDNSARTFGLSLSKMPRVMDWPMGYQKDRGLFTQMH